jgi:hypothetical protein
MDIADIQHLRIPLRLGDRPARDIFGDYPRLWRGNPAKISVALLDGGDPVSVSELASITLEVCSSQTSTSSPLMIKTVAAANFGSPTASTWADGTAQHALFEFTGDETNLTISGAYQEFWLVIHGLRVSGGRTVFAVGSLIVEEDNAGNAGSPPVNAPDYYTAVETDALLAARALLTDPRFTDSREWTASTVSQAEAEAGSATTRRAWTALRVWQAIQAWWNASAMKTKLDGIATGATANQTDAQLRDRSTHTGTQTASTISDFNAAVIASAGAFAVTSVDGKTGAVNLSDDYLGKNAQAADADPAGASLAAAFALKADDNAVVKLTGNQTVSGQKTFTDVLTGPNFKTGVGTTGTGSLIGDKLNNSANGSFAVAEGASTTASGDFAHAEGATSVASGTASHAEGSGTTASGFFSHAEGSATTASGDYSHAAGRNCQSKQSYSRATGRRAISDHSGSVVDADGQNADVSSTAANQRTARFAGGYRWLGGDHFMAGSVFAPPKVVSASITAELDGVYHGVATATYTDPTPAEGRGFAVRVVNGTATVGGTAYAAEGTVIFREFHSGAWRNRVLFGGADAAGVRANIGLPPATEAEMRAGTVTDPRAMSPANVAMTSRYLDLSPSSVNILMGSDFWTAAVVTGTGTQTRALHRNIVTTGTTAGSTAIIRTTLLAFVPSAGNGTINYRFNFARPLFISASFERTAQSNASEGVAMLSYGKTTNTVGDLNERGVAVKITGTSANRQAILQVHNGTSLNESTGVSLPNTAQMQVVIFSDGAGNVSLWAGEVVDFGQPPTATVTGGPTSITINPTFAVEVANNGSAANAEIGLHHLKAISL